MVDQSAKAYSIRLNEVLDYRNFPKLNNGRLSEFSDLLELSLATVSPWVHGDSKPNKTNRKRIAEKLQVSQEWLDNGFGDMNPSPVSNDKEINLIDFIEIENIHNWKDTGNISKQPYKIRKTLSKNTFATKTNDDSMWPIFPNGSIIFIKPTSTCNNKWYMAAHIISENKNIIRQYIDAGNGDLFLKPLCGNDHPYLVNQDIIPIGIIEYAEVTIDIDQHPD
jgi:transcriptional regulator with XRE-family HTH domain